MPSHKHIFVGRKTELEQFQQIIGQTGKIERLLIGPGRNVMPRVFLPYGIGGIGKTELSKRCAKIAAEAGWRTILIEWDKVEYRPLIPAELMDAIADALKTVAGEGVIKPYLDDRQNVAVVNGRVQRYRVDHPEEWQKLIEIGRTATGAMPDPTTKLLAATATIAADVGPKVLAHIADALVARKILKNSREALLYKDPDTQLAHHLVKAIVDAAKDQSLLMVFDTCEWLSVSLEEFLRDSIVCPAVEQGSGLLFVVSGRFSQYRERAVEDSNGNRKSIKGYADRLVDSPPIVWDLSLFADPEVADYLKECELEPTADLVGFVQRLARGVPFAVQLVAEALLKLGTDRVKQDFPPKDASEYDPQEIVTLVVRRFLRYCMDNAADEDRLRALAMLRTRDHAALREVWNLKEEEKPRQVLADLEARYGFVQPDGSLHEVVRDFLRDSLRGEDRETALRLGQSALNHYGPRWDEESSALPLLADRLAEDRWCNLTLNRLSALCWCDETNALRFLAGRAVEALEFNWPFAKGLIELAREFRNAPDWWATRSTRRFDMIARAIEGQDQEEMTGLDGLLRDSTDLKLDQAQCCVLHMWRTKNYLKQDRPNEALTACLEAEKRLPADESVRQTLAEVFGDVGSRFGFKRGMAVASLEGKLAYEHATALDPDRPAYHNGLGAMFAMLKDRVSLQQAQSRFTRAIELDPNDATAYNNRGVTYADLKNYEAALADYARAIDLDPNYATAYTNRGITYANLKDYEAALADFTRAIDLDPDGAQAYYNRGSTYAALKNYEAALVDFTRAIDLDPNGAQAYNNRGLTYAALKNHEAALADFTRAIDLDPNGAQAYNNRGNTYRILRNYQAAKIDLDEAIELDPNDAPAYGNRGLVYEELQDHSRALADFSHAIELGLNDAQAYSNRGSTYADLKNHEAALADYARAIDLDPNYATAYTNRGITYANLKDYEAALADFTRVLKIDPNDAQAYSNRGLTYRALKNYEAALADYTRALELDPNDAQAYTNRGVTYANLKDYEAALADFTRVLEIDPNDAQAYYNRGSTYHELKNYEAALADYTRALELDPNDAEAYTNRGNAYYALKNYEAALADQARALELAPNDAEAYYNRGNTYADLKNYAAALTDYTRALELDPDDPWYYNSMADLYDDQGNYSLALERYATALQLDPNEARFWSNRGLTQYHAGNYTAALADFSAAIERNPKRARYYAHRGLVLHRLNKVQDAQRDFEQALTLEEDNNVFTDIAARFAIEGNLAEVMSNLRKAFELDAEATLESIKTDPDFDSIRDTPEFQGLMREFESKP